MKYGLMPWAMWTVFAGTFRRHLHVLHIEDKKLQTEIMKKAHGKYREIIASIDEFGENDTHLINIISAAQFAAIYLSLPPEYRLTPATGTEVFPETAEGEALVSGAYTLRELSDFYEFSMNDNPVMKQFAKQSFFSASYWEKQAASAGKSQSSVNPYSWRFNFIPGEPGQSFEADFLYCGIWYLMRKLGIPEITPAMCRYDFGMTKLTDAEFSRAGTLAGGAAVCDCHYKKRT